MIGKLTTEFYDEDGCLAEGDTSNLALAEKLNEVIDYLNSNIKE